MKLIYVAGPFRGANSWEVECNIRRAETLALEVWRLGAAAICPHTNTRFFSGAAADSVWLDGDIEILRRCDAMILVDGWERSAGTRAEVLFAGKNSICICHSLRDLEFWLKLQKEVDESREIEQSRKEYFQTSGEIRAQLLQLQSRVERSREITVRLLNYFDGNTQRGS